MRQRNTASTALKYEYSTRESVCQAWVQWLSGFEWQWFAHLTWAIPVGMVGARRSVNRWVHGVCPGAYAVIGYEHPPWGLLHCHAVIGGVQGQRRDKAWLRWFQRNGRALIVPLRSVRGVHYVCKYATKGGGDCLDIIGTPKGLDKQIPLCYDGHRGEDNGENDIDGSQDAIRAQG